MNRWITAVFAALEALLVVGIGIGIPLVPLTMLWAFQYGLQLDWTVFWRASVDVWILGHGGDVLLTLDPVTAAAVGFEGAGSPFVVSVAALGFALLTLLFGVRAGRRVAETPFARLGTTVALVTFVGLAFGVTVSAVHEFARPSLWQGVLFPSLVFAVGLLIGVAVTRRRRERMPGSPPVAATGRIRTWWRQQPSDQRTVLVEGARAGVAAVAALVALSAVALAVMMVANYGQIIALYEGVHAGVLGGIVLTLGQLAFLPNLVVWSSAWLVGPGFAIGTGSSVGPLGTALGPLPAIPILGALPTEGVAIGFLGLLVPVVVGFLAGVAVRPAVLGGIGDRPATARLVVTGIVIGVSGGVVLGLLAWISGGAAGPGRLAEVGPDALLVGGFAAVEFCIPAILGLLTGRTPRGDRVDTV